MGFRLSELPVAMRDHGVTVVEVAGCYGRGREFPRAPIGGIDHWTQGGATGEAPSLTAVTFGRKTPTPLDGPLAQVLRARRVGRTPPRAFFVADGVANHAGRGRLVTTSGRVADGNDELFGLEVEYRAYAELITDEDLDVDARIHAAAAEVCGYSHHDVVGHWEYALPAGRKVDRKTIAGSRLRQLVQRAMNQREAGMKFTRDEAYLYALASYQEIAGRKADDRDMLTQAPKWAEVIERDPRQMFRLTSLLTKEARERLQAGTRNVAVPEAQVRALVAEGLAAAQRVLAS